LPEGLQDLQQQLIDLGSEKRVLAEQLKDFEEHQVCAGYDGFIPFVVENSSGY
jgi:hypothetical protein